MPFEIDFPQMVLDSFFSGILDVNAQYSGFQKQKFPAWIPESLLPCRDWKKKKKKKKRLLYFKNDSNHKGFTLSIDTKTMIDI